MKAIGIAASKAVKKWRNESGSASAGVKKMASAGERRNGVSMALMAKARQFNHMWRWRSEAMASNIAAAARRYQRNQ